MNTTEVPEWYLMYSNLVKKYLLQHRLSHGTIATAIFHIAGQLPLKDVQENFWRLQNFYRLSLTDDQKSKH